jgi:transposase|tara:strand:- start:575 stop:1645 length:1071 start_codon:yes stop_codon:yes gene_type:complete
MKGQKAKLDFKGQDIFVGLDIGKKSWKTAIYTEKFEHKTISQPPKVDVLVNYLKRNFPGATYHSVYEAGYFGYWIHEQLQKAGVNSIVVNPADVPTTHKEKTNKRDKVDARKLARNLRNTELKAIYVPEENALQDRSLVRMRHHFVKKQTRCKNQIRAQLRFYGAEIPEELVDSHWSRRFITWIEELSSEQESSNIALNALLDELLHLRQTITTLSKEIRSLATKERYKSRVSNLVTIPGISTLSAMILLTELVDIDRFASLDQLASYVGLVPGEHSSSESEVTTGISPRRNSRLRALIIEAAWVAVRKDPALMMTFNTLTKRMTKNKAIIRIARKLLNRIRFVLKNNCPYQTSVV